MNKLEKAIFNRTELLLGADVMQALSEVRVILFGVGGVGSWCAEGLVRSGVKHLTIVDSDRVSITNVNRQLMATTKTVGQVKVEALKNHLLEINPNAEIEAIQAIYCEDTAVVSEMQVICDKIRAIGIVDAPVGTTVQDAIKGRGPQGTINFNTSSDS